MFEKSGTIPEESPVNDEETWDDEDETLHGRDDSGLGIRTGNPRVLLSVPVPVPVPYPYPQPAGYEPRVRRVRVDPPSPIM